MLIFKSLISYKSTTRRTWHNVCMIALVRRVGLSLLYKGEINETNIAFLGNLKCAFYKKIYFFDKMANHHALRG